MVIEVQTTEGAAFPFGDHKPIYRSPTLPDPLHLGEENPWRLGIGNGCLVMLNTFSKKDHSFLQLLLKLKPKNSQRSMDVLGPGQPQLSTTCHVYTVHLTHALSQAVSERTLLRNEFHSTARNNARVTH